MYAPPTAAGQAGLWNAGRDVEMPSTRTFEFGYRQLIGQSFVIDISAFNKKQRAGAHDRSLPFEDPNNPGCTVYQNVLTNLDFTESNGIRGQAGQGDRQPAPGQRVLHVPRRPRHRLGSVDLPGPDQQRHLQSGVPDRQAGGSTRSAAAAGIGAQAQPRNHREPAVTADYMAGTTAGAIFNDLGVFAILYARSGQRFTKMENIGRTARSRLPPAETWSSPRSAA